ncbi:MAG: 3-phosphoshikimate 1-carboxyvinyltransferase [Candidatus Protochlamydia sp.]|nr:3-phosphoshikimate 1-carboxyvinyltransferase [Candidatus Protochlamydia sp.]
MNILELDVLKNPCSSTIEIPGSKSYTNRALVIAALTKGAVVLRNPLYSEDTEALIACLRMLGLYIETLPDQTIVHDDISVIENRYYELFAKDSGTTLRFLLPFLCLIPGTKVIVGNCRLNERPIKELVDALRLLGAKIDYLEKEGQAPLKIDSSALSGSRITIDASISSQFLSALLMIAPLLNGLRICHHGEVISKPYIEMTIRMMQEWGVGVLRMDDGSYLIPEGKSYQKKHYVIEGDFSSAGYFFAIAALTRSTLTIKNLNPYSLQADSKFLNILEEMGNEVIISSQAVTLVGKQILPLSFTMEDCPDQVQTMAVLAAFAKGTTKISGVRSLRLKETERVKALKKELAKMGIKTEDSPDTLTIFGGSPHAALIDTYGDHRMAMAFAVAGKKLPGMQIAHPEVVNKTFPTFWEKLNSL